MLQKKIYTPAKHSLIRLLSSHGRPCVGDCKSGKTRPGFHLLAELPLYGCLRVVRAVKSLQPNDLAFIIDMHAVLVVLLFFLCTVILALV
jgi:hypothetical protein